MYLLMWINNKNEHKQLEIEDKETADEFYKYLKYKGYKKIKKYQQAFDYSARSIGEQLALGA